MKVKDIKVGYFIYVAPGYGHRPQIYQVTRVNTTIYGGAERGKGFDCIRISSGYSTFVGKKYLYSTEHEIFKNKEDINKKYPEYFI